MSKFSFKINSSTAKTEELSCNNIDWYFQVKQCYCNPNVSFPQLVRSKVFFIFFAMLKIAHPQ